MGSILVKNAIRRKKGKLLYVDKYPKREEKRRAGRRRKSFGAVIFKEGANSVTESGDEGYETYMKVIEGKVNKKVLQEVNRWMEQYKIIKVTPKTKGAFVEIHMRGHRKATQSVYLIKNNKKTAKVIMW